MHQSSRLLKSALVAVVCFICLTLIATAQSNLPDILSSRTPTVDSTSIQNMPCENGFADATYACDNVDLLSFLPLSQIGGGNGADVWGWTDSQTGREYALMARSNGIAFVDVTDPNNAVYLGNLPSHSGASAWRDVKVYKDHAYIVADALSSHRLQIFNLAALRSVTSPPVTFQETAVYDNIGAAHNIFINEETGYGYIVGAGGSSGCSGGLHMINLKSPAKPSFAGCFSQDGYTHDTQCVVYQGPDVRYQNEEVCFNANEDSLTIVDVSNKAAPVQLARQGHPGAAYTHQGWLTADQAYFIMNDEVDEGFFGHNTRTYVWDVRDLEQPIFVGYYEADNTSRDHNLYIHDGLIYQANYTSGLRLFKPGDLSQAELHPMGYFDTYPSNDAPTYNGAWSTYPFFESGTILISDINRGLFVVRMAHLFETAVSTATGAPSGETVNHTITIHNKGNRSDSYTITVADNQWTTTPSATTVGPIAPGEEATVTIAVTVGSGSEDTVSIGVTSDGDNKIQETITITTEATKRNLYLPLIKKG